MKAEFLKGQRSSENSASITALFAGLALTHVEAEVIRIDLIGGSIDQLRHLHQGI